LQVARIGGNGAIEILQGSVEIVRRLAQGCTKQQDRIRRARQRNPGTECGLGVAVVTGIGFSARGFDILRGDAYRQREISRLGRGRSLARARSFGSASLA
jgi:hypothetical protein